ncbi:MAG: ATP-binding protein [Cyanobacteria bacterium P01_F01_bin.86]
MLVSQYTLTSALLDEVFPFHLALDTSLIILQVGQTLERIAKRSLVGKQLSEEFSILRPELECDFTAILSKQSQLFLLKQNNSLLQLKGQMLLLEETQSIIFLCSPWAADSSILPKLGIKLKDYAIHDSMIDYLLLQRTHQTALEDLKKVNKELLHKYEELEESLKTQKLLAKSAAEQSQRSNTLLEELKKTQAKLLQADKMSALGSLSAGIAHEINNPTSFLYGNIPHAQEYFSDLLKVIQAYQEAYPSPIDNITAQLKKLDFEFIKRDLPTLLNSMMIGAERIIEIVKSLQAFSRGNEACIKAINIHDGINSTLTILNSRLKTAGNRPGISVFKQYADLPLIECYAGPLNQVFMNLIVNAIDALEMRSQSQSAVLPATHSTAENSANHESPLAAWSPTLTITTQVLADDWVRIMIQDNGTGIPEDIQLRIFEPFFTTKGIGKGTGLGMSISYQIVVEQHEGRLSFKSQEGEGTCFTVDLPIRTIAQSPAKAKVKLF